MLYLITGGAGFIGSNIVKYLLQKGAHVRILDNFSTGKRDNIREFLSDSHLELIEGDLRNYQVVRQAVEDVDYILHQGALPSVPRSISDPVTTNEVNILGTLHVLEAAKEFKVKRTVYASSSSVYGDTETLPKIETMPIKPLSPYALAKYAGERYCQIYNQIYGLETVCLRYFNVFGPKQDPASQYSAVIPKFIKLIREIKRPVIYGDGHQSRDFTYVENVVRANILACEANNVQGQVFNVACGERTTLLRLVEAINCILKTDVKPIFEKERIGDVKHSEASIEKAKELLHYKVVRRFEEGLELTIAG